MCYKGNNRLDSEVFINLDDPEDCHTDFLVKAIQVFFFFFFNSQFNHNEV